jgi:cobalt-zinc-cadmium efflux system membrane fusion protein
MSKVHLDNKRTRIIAVSAAGLVLLAIAFAFWPSGNANDSRKATHSPASKTDLGAPVELVPNKPDTVRFPSEATRHRLGIETVSVTPAPVSESLRLPGTLVLDPSRVVRVNARFSGEAARITEVKQNAIKRQLQYGDHVGRGEVLAVVWSKDIGEKKSELIDAKSRLETNRLLLNRIENLPKGIITERQV